MSLNVLLRGIGWREELVEKYGEPVVRDIEEDAACSVPWPCRDTMDARKWCRVHDAPWPSNVGRILAGEKPTGCEAWSGEDES